MYDFWTERLHPLNGNGSHHHLATCGGMYTYFEQIREFKFLESMKSFMMQFVYCLSL
jgi:hypothetical protein